MAEPQAAVPARLHVLLARDTPQAVIIRRGPSKRTAVIGWDRGTDTFLVGQWLKGKLYHYRCDISPDGRHWIYFAMSDRDASTWTAVARAPYLRALDFYPKGDSWNGGGLFAGSRTYWLNDAGPTPHSPQRQDSGLSVVSQWLGSENEQGESPGIYFRRLLRDGWRQLSEEAVGRGGYLWVFSKRANTGWDLHKRFHAGIDRPLGKGCYWEEHHLHNSKTGAGIDLPDWEWADVDGCGILWAANGKVYRGTAGETGLGGVRELFDTNPLTFTELVAPYR